MSQTKQTKMGLDAAYSAHAARSVEQARRIAPRFIPGKPMLPADAEIIASGMVVANGRLRCVRTGTCEISLDVSNLADEKAIESFGIAHGFQWCNGNFFCGSTCITQHMSSPDSAAGAVPFKPKTPVDIAPKRITVTNGAVHCDYAVCESKFQTDAADETRLLGTAAANGWVETKDGVFCGGGCAKRARADIAAGIQPARTYADAVAEVVGSVPAGEVGR